MTVPQIFDRHTRRRRRDRVARSGFHDFEEHTTGLVLERLTMVTRRFDRALVINTGFGMLASALRGQRMDVTETDHGLQFAKAATAILCDEDDLPVAERTYDMVLAPAGFDTINDLPGALIAARRALKPDGLFMAILCGAPSLISLRAVLDASNVGNTRAISRIHPQIDVRAAGDLLQRTGFALPTADTETLRISYRSLGKLTDDIRASGASNVLRHRFSMSRKELAQASDAFSGLADSNGRVTETVTLIAMTGWAPPAL